MREIKLDNGFTGEVDETKFDDMRFVDLLASIMDEDAADSAKLVGFSKLITFILGPEQKKTLYDCIIKKHGRVPVAVMQENLDAIMRQVKSGPN